MKASAFTATGMILAMCTVSHAGDAGDYNDGNTTVVRNGNSVAIVTQSGDPARAEVRVHKEPGRTTIYRRNGGNTTVITQSATPADVPMDALPPWLRDRLRR
jgi:hypothetical protein